MNDTKFAKKVKFLLIIMALCLLAVSTTANATASPRLSTARQTLAKTESFTLTIKNVIPKKAKIKVSSSKNGIVSIGKVKKQKSTATIKVTAKNKGTTTIKVEVKQNGRTSFLSCKVTVEQPSVSLTKKSLKTGETFTLKLKGTKRTVSFSSSSKNVTVIRKNSQSATVKAKKAGTYTVKAKVGTKTYTCKVSVSCKIHRYKGVVTTKATCSAKGVKTYTCKDCGQTKTSSIAKVAHKYKGKVTKKSTCKAKGVETYTCQNCDSSYTVALAMLTEHSYDNGKVTTEPTCTEDGVKTYTCTICGQTTQEAINATGHTVVIDTPEVKATCTQTGYTAATHCSTCGETIQSQEVISMIDHSYDDGTVTTEPTCTENGIKTFTCTICGQTKEETMDMVDHEYVETTTKTWVVDMPAYDDDKFVRYELGYIHYPCAYFSTNVKEINRHLMKECSCDPSYKYGDATYDLPVYETVHHEEEGHYEDIVTAVTCKVCGKQKQYVVDKEAYDEEVEVSVIHGWRHDKTGFFTTDFSKLNEYLVESTPNDIIWNEYYTSASNPDTIYINKCCSKDSVAYTLSNNIVMINDINDFRNLPSDKVTHAFYSSPSQPEWAETNISTFNTRATEPVYVTIHHLEEGHFE